MVLVDGIAEQCGTADPMTTCSWRTVTSVKRAGDVDYVTTPTLTVVSNTGSPGAPYSPRDMFSRPALSTKFYDPVNILGSRVTGRIGWSVAADFPITSVRRMSLISVSTKDFILFYLFNFPIQMFLKKEEFLYNI